MPTSGGEPKLVSASVGSRVRWSTDGRRFFFRGRGDKSKDFWSLDLDDSTERRRTALEGRRGRLNGLASDGVHLYFSWAEDFGDIWVMDVVTARSHITKEIGRGGMGIVYKAVDLKLNREVALKVLPPELVADRERKRRFIQEAQAAGALEHPNIGVIHEIDEVDDVAFIVMELIDGEKLSDILMRERLPVARICQLVSEIAEGLACAHDKGIIHRDLKPANVMVTHDGRAKIIDFGLAKLAEPISDARSAVETAIREKTRSHAVMGTVSYMSPEQALGQPVDARSDLFSLGVALYEMATGSKPFDGDTTAAVCEAILHETPTSPRQLNEELPPPLEQIIGKLLKKDPGARFQSSYELVEALRRVELDMREPSGAATLARRLREPRWAIAVVALVAVTSLFVVCTIQHGARVRWAREQAIPEITRLIEDEAFVTAFELASEAEAYIPDDPTLAKLWPELSRRVSVETVPEGADVYLQAYGATENEWEYLGKSPLDDARIPRGFFRWKMTRRL